MSKHPRAWRWAGYAALAAVLALAFAGYLHPDMLLDWEVVMRMCGLR